MTDDHNDIHSDDDAPQAPLPTLWPLGFAIGVACIIVGLVVSTPAIIVGAIVTLVFGFLWVRELSGWGGADAHQAAKDAVEHDDHVETYDRGGFLTAGVVGIGGVIGAGVALPSIGFGILPSFVGDAVKLKKADLGPITNFPEGQFVVATYMEDAEQGEVSRRTAYIRNNGFAKSAKTGNDEPSFTVMFSRCAHLGCPVQPAGLLQDDEKKQVGDVTLIPAVGVSGFVCPCHGGSYDKEGNRVAGPPVRALDRFEFSIENGNLVLGRLYSVAQVESAGANARIEKHRYQYPGTPVDGWESWLYPIPTPGT